MKITIIPEENCIEAGGIKYSFEFFSLLGEEGFPEGTYFQIVSREDGRLTVRRYDPAGNRIDA